MTEYVAGVLVHYLENTFNYSQGRTKWRKGGSWASASSPQRNFLVSSIMTRLFCYFYDNLANKLAKSGRFTRFLIIFSSYHPMASFEAKVLDACPIANTSRKSNDYQ